MVQHAKPSVVDSYATVHGAAKAKHSVSNAINDGDGRGDDGDDDRAVGSNEAADFDKMMRSQILKA